MVLNLKSFRRNVMNNSNDIFNEMNSLWLAFHENHTKFSNNGTKAAGARARKDIGSIKNQQNISDKNKK